MRRLSTHIELTRAVPTGAALSVTLGLCLSAWGCGGGTTTVEGDPPIIPSVSAIAPGDPTCPAGGVRVQTGVDDNRDGVLSADEVDQVSSVCNGSDVVAIEDNVLVRTVTLSPGPECADGGRRLDIGLDNGDGGGTAGNATLEDDEVDTSFLDCNDAPMVVGVTPPGGAAGAFVLDTHGGSSTNGEGGDGGDLVEEGGAQQIEAYLMLSETGTAAATCTAPTLTLDLGAHAAVVSADLTLPVVPSGSEGSLSDGALYGQTGTDGILIWDATNTVGVRATGLRVASGATLTLPDLTTGTGVATLSFDADVDVQGTIVTAPFGSERVALRLSADRVVLGASSVIDTNGAAAGDDGGSVDVSARRELLALGSITTAGTDGPDGGDGGRVSLFAGAQLYTGGSIATRGGAASTGQGGTGGGVDLEAESRLLCNAADVTTDGGAGVTGGGDGGSIRLGADCIYGVPLELRSPGALRARGGAQMGTCDPQSCSAGDGGEVRFTAGYGGSISTSGGLDTRGGDSASAGGGDGGDVFLGEGYTFDSLPVVRRYDVSGNVTTFGGNGPTDGGDGGNLTSSNIGALGSATRYLGYPSALLSGGSGSTVGGTSGDVLSVPGGGFTGGGLGLYIFGTDITGVGGDAPMGSGGQGGDIVFSPSVGGPGGPGGQGGVSQNAPRENVIILANATLHGGSGMVGGHGGDIAVPSGCNPSLVTTGIRIDGTFDLDGGAGTTGRGGEAGEFDLATLRGAASLSGSVSAAGGSSSMGSGGSFFGSVLMGVPATLGATVVASGGAGAVDGGDAASVVVVSFGGPSSVTGSATITAGTGTSGANGSAGTFQVDSGDTCINR